MTTTKPRRKDMLTYERHNCIYAAHIDVKEQCEYWTIIATDVGAAP